MANPKMDIYVQQIMCVNDNCNCFSGNVWPSCTHSSLITIVEEGGEVWSDSDIEDECDVTEPPPGTPQCDTSPTSSSPVDASSRSLVKWLLTFFLLLQAHFHLADRVLNFIFTFLKRFFVVFGQLYGPCAALGVELPATLYKAKRAYKNSQSYFL